MAQSLCRAYSVLELKSVDDDLRIIEGIASTPSTDRVGDIVEPEGAQYSLPMPLLWQHRADQPIGQVLDAKVGPKGISIRAQIAKDLLPRIDEAWLLIKSGLVRGLSIGFKAIEEADITGTWGTRFTKWEWLELSAVTIPANADASIQTIKSCDVDPAASPGTVGRVVHSLPGASGARRSVVSTVRAGVSMKKTYAEQIQSFEATRAAKNARMDEILGKASESGATLDPAQKEEHDTLSGEVKEIDEHLARLREAEARNKAAAVAVKGADPGEGSGSRGRSVITVDRKLPPGIAFARYCAIVAASKGNPLLGLEMAKARFPDDTAMHAIFKGAVGAGTTSASNWADDLVPYQAIASDFIEYLRPRTIIDRFGQGNIPGLRRVPFNVRVGGFSAGTTGYWKGEGKPITVSKATSTNVALTWSTVGGLVVLTNELVRFSTPSAEAAIRDDIARAVISRMDIDFVDPTKVAVANTSPASITYGVAATAPTGTTAAKLRHDLATMYGIFAAANMGGLPVLMMSQTMAIQISGMVNTLGGREFPDFTPQGGSIDGIPALVSEHLTSVGSPSTQTIVAVIPSEVYLADDGQVTVDASSEASIEMLDGSLVQDGTAGTGASLVSLWQNGLLGLRAERVVNWKVRRSGAAQYISPAAYIIQ